MSSHVMVQIIIEPPLDAQDLQRALTALVDQGFVLDAFRVEVSAQGIRLIKQLLPGPTEPF